MLRIENFISASAEKKILYFKQLFLYFHSSKISYIY